MKKNTGSSSRPTGRLPPTPADLAAGSIDLAARESRARRGAIIVLDEEETILWRCALPRAGWWRTAQRARLSTRPLSQRQRTRDESLTRQAWLPDHSWSRIPSGVLLSVIGAVPYGTSKVFSKIVPPFDTEALRHSMHPIRHLFGTTAKEVVMVVDRSGIHRAKKLASTLAHDDGQLQCHLFPAHCGQHLNPIAGFGRVRKDTLGAGRCCSTLHQLYWRIRQGLMAHHERPLYAFHW